MFLLSADYYRIKESSKKGRGVFSRKEIPAGTIIGDYLGKIVKDSQLGALEKKYGDSCYAMDYDDDRELSVFPADIKAPGIHLINHSCASNCEAYYYFGHTLYFAVRRILPGEELTIDYGFDPGEGNALGLLYPCLCGSSYCRGTMYSNADRIAKHSRYYYQETKNQAVPALNPGDTLGLLEKYPDNIPDNAVFDLFAHPTAAPLICNEEKLPPLSELRKRLRESGRMLNFKNLGFLVVAVTGKKFIALR